MEIALSIVGKVLVAPISRGFGYLLYYNSKIENLRYEVEKLENMRYGMLLLVDVAKRNGEVITPEVEIWLRTVEQINRDAERLMENAANVGSCLSGSCPNLYTRYMLSKKATRMTWFIVEVQYQIKYDRFSVPVPAAAAEAKAAAAAPERRVKSTSFKVFESRIWTMKELMEALKDDDIDMIGICGMAGVGKTKTVKEVVVRIMKENVFDEVAMVVVSQDISKIQVELAKMLGLKLEGESSSERAGQLHQRLSSVNRTLLIFDDVWAKLDLEAIGIPWGSDHNNCKIVLTSRNQEVCTQMGSRAIFRIDVLPEAEAWSFFREFTSVDTPELYSTAIQVVIECGGLPIAIETIGRALKHASKQLWDDALSDLRKSNPTKITGLQANVYQPIQRSYDYLSSEETQLIFLLCCLFPEDSDILLEDLVRYAMGLRLFEGVCNVVGEVRDRVHTIVDNLQSCFLLLDSGKADSVKVHDVVRDVGKSIASKDKHVFMVTHDVKLKEWPRPVSHGQYNAVSVNSDEIRELPEDINCPRLETYEHYTAISVKSDEIRVLPEDLNCPRLEVLLLACKNKLLKMPENLFEQMRELKVLELQAMSVRVLPSSLAFLTNLRTLCMRNCKLENISVIGELEKLEILSFYGSFIKKLPQEIGRLKNLRLLDLTECSSLETISPGVISGLVRLEELYMRKSLRQWKPEEGKERSNASLAELESLSHLKVFHWIPSHQ